MKHMSTQNGNLLCISTVESTLDYYKKKNLKLKKILKKLIVLIMSL